MKKILLLFLLPLVVAAKPAEDYAAPYRILREANQTLDADLAAQAYSEDGRLMFEIPGSPVEEFRGRSTIRASYLRTFSQVDPGTAIDLEFRFAWPGLVGQDQIGAYRASLIVRGKSVTVYGKFAVRLHKEDGAWRFLEDRGATANAAEFEALPRATL